MANRTSRNDGGATLQSVETPSPLVDLDRLERNLKRMADYTARHGLALRPHVKTHKTPWIAARQVELGAVGVTCATMREAEEMSAEADDILLAYPPVGPARLRRLTALPPAVRTTVALDSAIAVEMLGEAARSADRQVGVLVELDLGMRRVGVATASEAVDLARLVARDPGLEFRGLAFYPGHIRTGVQSQDEAIARLRTDVSAARDAFEAAGLDLPVISGGSTPTAWRAHETGATEVRPGTYVFNDRTTAMMGACSWEDCALTVLATVISTAVAGQAVIDAGSKALGREPLRSGGDGFGVLLDRPEIVVTAMSEEHGLLDLSRTDWRPAVGEMVRVIPNHVCIVVHLNDRLIGVRDDMVETEWLVSARGRQET